MSIIVKSSSAVQERIDELRELNNQFRAKTTDIRQEQSTLTTKWQGEASDTFAQSMNRKLPNLDTFASVVDEYCNALSQMLANMENTEAKNVAIASE